MAYIGMTAATLSTREQTRWRKFKQLANGEHVNAEPAIRVWHLKGTFLHHIPIVMIQTMDADEALAIESRLVQELYFNMDWFWVNNLYDIDISHN
jgi:hypothetical protein